MKQGSLFVLFCTHEIHRTGMLQITFLVSLESSQGEGVHRLGSMVFGLGCKSSWILNDFHTENKIKSQLKISEELEFAFGVVGKILMIRIWWNLPLVLLERSWWSGFNGIYLIRFGFRMWDILILKWFLRLKIQINSQKPGFGRKNQLRTW